MRPFRSLKSKLLLFSLCISLIPIAIITAVYYFNARSILLRHQLDELTAIAESKRLHILEFLERKKVEVISFGSDGFVRDCLETIKRNEFRRDDALLNLNRHISFEKKPLDPHIISIVVVDKDGKVVTSSEDTIIGKDVSSQMEFKQAIDKSYNVASFGRCGFAPYINANCITFSAPITSRRGVATIGVIINAYDINALSEITTNRVGMSETGEVYLVKRNGIMITESRFIEGAPLKQVVDTEPVQKIAEGGGEMTGIYPDYRGMPIVGASAYIPEYGWTLLAEIDKAEAFAPIKMLGIVALIVGLVSAAAVTSVAIIFALSVARPISKLKDVTDRFGAGDLKARVNIVRWDEIGKLAKSFNFMAEELSKETYKLSHAVEHSPSSVIITDSKGNIEYVNPKFTQITGYILEEVVGKNPSILKSGKTPPEEYKRLWKIITTGGEWRGEFCNKKKNGELYWESVSISSIKNSAGAITHFISVCEDITERKRADETIQQMAYYDTLTALPNRTLFNDRLTMELAHAHRNKQMLALLFLDLDRFKVVNDTLGHTMGDQLLKEVAERLKNCVREEDTIARMGGDEFTLILPGIVHVDDVTKVASKILESVKKPLMLDDYELNITISIGITIYPNDGEDAEILLRNADIAMYRAKEKGRDNYQYYT